MTDPAPLFTAQQIREACDGHITSGTADTEASGISTDTRDLRPEQAFIALVGDNHDAHNFLPHALKIGAPILVVEEGREPRDVPRNTTVIAVTDTTAALMDLAAWHRTRLEGTVIGVTGSCGKSTVKTMLGSILSHAGQCSVAQKSFNNRIGVSLTLLGSRIQDDFVVLELGTNHPGEIDELAGIAQPHAGLITCIGKCHLEGLGDREGVREAKAELIPHVDSDGMLALNADDEMCASLAGRYSGEIRTFGLHPGADYQPLIMETKSDGTQEEFLLMDRDFHIPLPGRYNVLNAAAAISLARWAGASFPDCRKGLSSVSLPGMRFEKNNIAGTDYILDCYNSNPTATRAVIDTYIRIPVDGRRIVVFGDMLELGDAAPHLHREMGMLMALAHVDVLVAVGEYAQHVVDGWKELASPDQRAMRIPSVDKAWLFVWKLSQPGDTVLLKGSRQIELERITDAIAERELETKRGEVA